jgi:hypothetical protein
MGALAAVIGPGAAVIGANTRVIALITRVIGSFARVSGSLAGASGSFARVIGPHARVRRPNTRADVALAPAIGPGAGGRTAANSTSGPPVADQSPGKTGEKPAATGNTGPAATDRSIAMGRTVPETQQDAIDFFATRVGDWAKGPAAIGLTSSQIDEINLRLGEAQTRLAEAHAARIAARTATLALNDAMRSLRGFGGDLVKTIRTFAETTEDASVYTASGIPPVSEPTPAGEPAKPTRVRAVISGTGPIAITWAGRRSGGVQFIVERRDTPVDAAPGPWRFVAVTPTNETLDNTVPPGLASVAYRVWAQSPAGASDASNLAVLAFGNAQLTTESNGDTPAITAAAA